MRHERGYASFAAAEAVRSHAGKAVASFLSASRKNLLPTFAFHACPEAVLFVATAYVRLKSSLWQRLLLKSSFAFRSFFELRRPGFFRNGTKVNFWCRLVKGLV